MVVGAALSFASSEMRVVLFVIPVGRTHPGVPGDGGGGSEGGEAWTGVIGIREPFLVIELII